MDYQFKDDDLVTADVACRIIGGVQSPISRATLYRMANKGIIAKPEKPSPGISRFRVRGLRPGYKPEAA